MYSASTTTTIYLTLTIDPQCNRSSSPIFSMYPALNNANLPNSDLTVPQASSSLMGFIVDASTGKGLTLILTLLT